MSNSVREARREARLQLGRESDAIAVCFKAGWSIEDLALVLDVDPEVIEAVLRRYMRHEKRR
jgi:hypothetical protein